MSKVHYVTTAIVYPNNKVHIGFAWECIAADWYRRGRSAFGEETFFVSGMDEHAIKVQKAAEAAGVTPKAHCDQMAKDIERALRSAGVDFDRFIRTSDTDHHWVVSQLVQKAFDQGDIYKNKYEGHYCEGCEAYYTEKDLVDGKCPAHQTVPKWISEENYFFKLSKFEKPLLEFFKNNPDFLQPTYRRAEIVNFIESGLKDFSISRSNFTWGIPLPFDTSHVIYVWFDALINYLTAAGIEFKLKNPNSPEGKIFDTRWPADLHIIGKDITRFHCIYWTAMLMSLGIELPKKIFAHGFLNLKGERMSKSSGNMVTPDEAVKEVGADLLRYYLLAENRFSEDGNFSWESLYLKVNADLANDWGNLVNRSISMTRKYYPEGGLKAPVAITHSAEIKDAFELKFKAELSTALDAMDTVAYAQACQSKSRMLNLYIDQMKPWKMAKEMDTNPEIKNALSEVLFTLLEGIRWIATAYLPLLPYNMPNVFEQLGVKMPESKGAIKSLKWAPFEFKPSEPKPIYPRLERPES